MSTKGLDLCPPPLSIRKKTRKATLYRRLLVKSPTPSCYDSIAYGPLDDIISEISGNIWRTPSDAAEPGFANWDWRNPLKASSTCIVTPLPVSRIASDQPLTVWIPATSQLNSVAPQDIFANLSQIRKNRHSRSSTSGSSVANTMVSSLESYSDYKSTTQGSFSTPNDSMDTPWPLFDDKLDVRALRLVSSADAAWMDPSASEAAEDSEQSEQTQPKRGSTRIGFIAKGLSRLRRATSSGDSKSLAPESSEVIVTQNESRDMDTLAQLMSGFKPHLADRIPSPVDHRFDEIERTQARPTDPKSVSSLKATIRITPEDHELKLQEVQEFWVAVEVVGALHNRQLLRDPTVDVAFLVDISYYVSEDCLQRALDAVMDTLQYLNSGDKVALYTTHCTHYGVAGTTPDVIYSLCALEKGTADTLANLTKQVQHRGLQSWYPPRPNPTMAEVVLAVAKSLHVSGSKKGQTHLIVLSPTTNILHTASKAFPQLYIHQMNPAVLPYQHSEHLQDPICPYPCCQHVFVNNWSHYQNLTNSIKQIIRNARSEKPFGSIENMHIDIRPRKGCEVLQYQGATDFKYLRLGQTHAFFVRVRVKLAETQEIDLDSADPFLNSSLDATYMRECLRNTKKSGVSMAHLLSVQLMHQNSLNADEMWSFTEAHLLLPRETGHRMTFTNTYLSFHKRHLFFLFSGMDTREAKSKLEKHVASLGDRKAVAYLTDRLGAEMCRQEKVLEYEESGRQNLPCIAGRVEATLPHRLPQWGHQDEQRTKLRSLSNL